MTDFPNRGAAASAEWDFPTLAGVWDYGTRAIVVGADKLEALPEAGRARSLTALSDRVSALTRGLDDGWLVSTASFMIEDLFKSYFRRFRWSPGVHDYIAATAGTFLRELTCRGFALHYVVDNTHAATDLAELLEYVPAVFQAAGLLVTGPQLMALELMEALDQRPRDIAAIPLYRDEGHQVADELIQRCHQERRSSVYLNFDLDDDTPGLALDVALSHAGQPGAIVVFRNQPPAAGSTAQITPPPGVPMPHGP